MNDVQKLQARIWGRRGCTDFEGTLSKLVLREFKGTRPFGGSPAQQGKRERACLRPSAVVWIIFDGKCWLPSRTSGQTILPNWIPDGGIWTIWTAATRTRLQTWRSMVAASEPAKMGAVHRLPAQRVPWRSRPGAEPGLALQLRRITRPSSWQPAMDGSVGRGSKALAAPLIGWGSCFACPVHRDSEILQEEAEACRAGRSGLQLMGAVPQAP